MTNIFQFGELNPAFPVPVIREQEARAALSWWSL
jgi:hypothetical protein